MSTLAPATDAELVCRAKQADGDAIAQLYTRYAEPIYRYIYFRVGEVEQAEDLCADVFLSMIEGIERYEDRGWPVSAWLYQIARARTVDLARRRRRRPLLPLDGALVLVDGPEHAVNTALLHEELERSLVTLTGQQQEVLRLRFWAELTIQQVAHKTGRSEYAVKSLQHRAVQALARQMNPLTA